MLAMLAAAARCFRAQPLTNAQGASEHLRTQVTAAELFYLRHLRTCAASASGNRSTCSAATPCLCTSGLLLVLDCIMSLVKVVLQDMLQALEFVMSMFLKVLRSTPRILKHLMSMFTAVLQSMPSPLEICALIAVVDVSDCKNCFQMSLRSPVCSLQCAIGTCRGSFHTTTLYAYSPRRFACKRYVLTRLH